MINNWCPRCKGFMRWDKFYHNGEFFEGWRCLICGEILDPLIYFHRTCPYEKTEDYSRREKRAEKADPKMLIRMEKSSKR